MFIVVASSSPHRQATYRDALVKLGHRVATAGNGIECVALLRGEKPDLLVLEAPLLWGGSDGVLEVVEQDLGQNTVPVIVLAVGSGSIDWFQLSRFQINDFLFRVPTTVELGRAIDSVAGQSSSTRHSKNGHGRQPQNRNADYVTDCRSSARVRSAASGSAAVMHH